MNMENETFCGFLDGMMFGVIVTLEEVVLTAIKMDWGTSKRRGKGGI
jgi:hypothetical protein